MRVRAINSCLVWEGLRLCTKYIRARTRQGETDEGAYLTSRQ